MGNKKKKQDKKKKKQVKKITPAWLKIDSSKIFSLIYRQIGKTQ